MHSGFLAMFQAFGASGLLLGFFQVVYIGLNIPETIAPRWLGTLFVAAAVALLGYVAFWLFFAAPWCGKIFSSIVFVSVFVFFLRALLPGEKRFSRGASRDLLFPALLAFVIGAGYIAFSYSNGGTNFFVLTRNRFIGNLPADNQIPNFFADRLWSGVSPKHLLGDWLSSDRPPLQTGWILLFRPILTTFFSGNTIGAALGVWFQLIWVPAIWAFLRALGTELKWTAAIVTGLCFSGFFIINTVYSWPKLSAASFLVGAFICFFALPRSKDKRILRRGFIFGGLLGALAFLSHGGTAFSLIGLAPLAVYDCIRQPSRLRGWLLAAALFTVSVIPWFAYQRFYEPPGDRLLKMHLAGQDIPQVDKSFSATVVEHYRAIGWKGAWNNRLINFRLQSSGSYFFVSAPWDPNYRAKSIGWEFFTTTGTMGCWLLCIIAIPWIAVRRSAQYPLFLSALIWWFSGWLAWSLMMFVPNGTVVHQGTYVTQIVGVSLLAWMATRIHAVLFWLIVSAQVGSFFYVWTPTSVIPPEGHQPLSVIVAGLSVVGLIIINIQASKARGLPAIFSQTETETNLIDPGFRT